MSIKDAILDNWYITERNYRYPMQILAENLESKLAYTVRFDGNEYGVAIRYDGLEVNEYFAGARVWTDMYVNTDNKTEQYMFLTTKIGSMKEQFAYVCEAFVDPGNDGENRLFLTNNPTEWWKKWKNLLGNKSIDERIYDELGELCVLLYVQKTCGNANWNGPFGASYDIETPDEFIEVKSTINKFKEEITINNLFQLRSADDRPLKLVRCIFEPCVEGGKSIDDVLDKLRDAGYDEDTLNSGLEKCGIERGMSERRKKFLLQGMFSYTIDDSFPRITPESFKGDQLPESIKDISYTVDMSGRDAKSIDITNLFD